MHFDTPRPTIAVVIPNHNDSAFLSACLESVLQQSVHPDQIIFVDDLSSDDSLSKAHLLLDGVDGVAILANNSRLGTMGALNEGLKQVWCDYALFLASNDYLIERMIERAKLSLEKLGKPGVWSAMVWAADECGRKKYIYPSPVIALKDHYFSPDECVRLAMGVGNWFTGTTMLFHRETLQSVGGFDVKCGGLADLFAALTVSSLKGAVFCPQPLGVMRVHSGGYLWKTLSNVRGLEEIFVSVLDRGKTISPRLFTEKFFNRMRRRIRFSACRASGFSWSSPCNPNWIGLRYKLLYFFNSLFSRHEKLLTLSALILLRSFDVTAMLRYRLLGWIIVLWKNKRSID